MSWRFRKRIKILPGVHLNFGKSLTPSISIGKRGVSVTAGRRGSYLNAGIPGTGISNRQRLSNGKNGANGSSFKSMFAVGFVLGILAFVAIGFLALLLVLTRF